MVRAASIPWPPIAIWRHAHRRRARRRNPYPGVAPFLTAVSAAASDTVITYGALRDTSARLAAWLRPELGVQRGDVIALAPTNDAASVIAIFALLAAGAQIFFINPAEKAERLRELLDGRRVRHIVYTNAATAEHLPAAHLLPNARELEQHQIGDIDPLPRLSDTAFSALPDRRPRQRS